MNLDSFDKLPWLAIGILWFVYVLLGWYLAAHHVVWIAGVGATLVTLIVTWKGVPLLNQLSWITSQSLLVATVVSLLISLGVIFFVTNFQFLGLIVLPFVTMFFADLEMRSAGFSQRQILLYLAAIAGLGMGLGEAIDLVLLPSMRY